MAQVAEACDLAVRACAGTSLADEAGSIRDRLAGPLRVAVAGRIKAGKSTLVNALVGERLAATDAGECTRLVTTYRFDPGYVVQAVEQSGGSRPLRFRRDDGALRIELDDTDLDTLAGIDIGWPTRSLAEIVLIDTPGLASLDDRTSRRTQDFLDLDASGGSGADAVIYLMRHLHVADAAFLGAFMDRSVSGASPVNALAVLSRADEVGACRADALDSAARIAARYADEPRLRNLVSAVVPVAGLLAETALTLREDEVASLRLLASMPADERVALCRSVDDLCDVALSPLTAEIRRDLLGRFGLYGLRVAIDQLAAEPTTTASDLSRALLDRSGLAALQGLLRDRFGSTGRLLQARSAVRGLRRLIGRLAEFDPAAATPLARRLDEIEAGGDFGRLTAAHLAMSGAAALGDDERAEVTRILLAADPLATLAALDTADLLASIESWRERGGGAFADSALVAVCDAMARTYEAAFASRY